MMTQEVTVLICLSVMLENQLEMQWFCFQCVLFTLQYFDLFGPLKENKEEYHQ